MAVPIVSVEKFGAYSEMIGFPSTKTEVNHNGELPQIFGDMFGWEEMTEKVAEVYNELPEDEKDRAAIFAGNYGEAGAIDHFGEKYGLPKAISPHQSYFLWGTRDYDGSIMIILGSDKEDAEKYCGSVEEKTQVEHRYAMPYERFKILICRELKEPLPKLWKDLRNWR